MSEFRVKGWHVLVVVLGFFGVTIAVNGLFIALALGTFSGEVSDDPYLQGLDYNETLAERAHQADVGWTATLEMERAPQGAARVVLRIRDADGTPVRGLAVTGEIGRPASAAHDVALAFEPAGASYVAVVDALPDGAWDLAVSTSLFDGAPFEAHRRIWLR